MIFQKQSSSIDLHTHSYFSDGIYSPAEIVKKAKEKNLYAVALTDHDTIAGVYEFVESAKNIDIRVIPGVEFSVSDYQGIKDIDVLGYFPDIALLDPIRDACEKIKNARERRLEKMIKIFQEDGIMIKKDDIIKENTSFFSVGRKHLAEAVLKNNPGRFKNIQEIFNGYLGSGCKADMPIECGLSIPVTIELIHACKGSAFLAHPGVSNGFPPDKDKGHRLINYACICGAEGAEGYYLYYKNRPYINLHMSYEENMNLCEEYIEHIKRKKKRYTAGSDSHGDNNIEIGENPGTAELLKNLFNRREI